MRSFLRRHVKVVAGSAVIGLGISAALAVATVPDQDGTIHGCYQVITIPGSGYVEPDPANSTLKVIDPSAPTPQTCDAASQRELTINGRGAVGPPGPPGVPGAPGTAGQQSTAGDCHPVVGHFTLSGSPSFSSDACSLRLAKVASIARSPGQAGSNEYEITRLVDGLSPKLAKAAVQGTIFKSATIQVYKPGTTTVGASYKLGSAIISSDKIGLGLVTPIETLTLISVSKKGT